MPQYTQENRPLAISTPLGKDVLLLEKLTGTEELSRLFRFEADMLTASTAPLPFEKLLAQPVTIRLSTPGWPTRYINGIVSQLTQGPQLAGPDGKDTFIRYRAEIVPRFWLWTRRIQSRIFQNLSVPQILEQVLQGLTVSFHLLRAQEQRQDKYQPRDHCVQYQESDFAFASRLMEEEGIFYYFLHTPETEETDPSGLKTVVPPAHEMIVTDSPFFCPNLSTVRYDRVRGGLRGEPRIWEWDKSQTVTATTYTVDDYCFELSRNDLKATASLPDTKVKVGITEHTLDLGKDSGLAIYDYPAAFAHRYDGINKDGAEQPPELGKIPNDASTTARIRLEEEAARGMLIRGAGDCWHFLPGFHFTFAGHFSDADPPEPGGRPRLGASSSVFLLTTVEHNASIEGSYTTGDEQRPLLYECRFRALPKGLPYRPLRLTPKARVEGTQTATVVGPRGEEIHCDKFGRVKVRFHWDRPGLLGAPGSCWIRVAQQWAGQNFGFLCIPRVGQEVVVDFLEGDPDKPIVVGSVYNEAHMPPFDLPAERTVSGIKSRTKHGAGGKFSGLAFDDTPDGEHVRLHAEQYLSQCSEGSMYTNVAKEQHVNVGSVNTQQVGGFPLLNHAQMPGSGGATGNSWVAPVTGGIGDNLSLVFGWNGWHTVGLNHCFTLGQTNTTTINPVALVDELMPSWAAVPFLKAFTSADISVSFGPRTDILYGTEVNIHRGSEMNRVIPANDPMDLADKAFVGSYTAAVLANMSAPYLSNTIKEGWGIVGMQAGMTAFLTGVQAAWINYHMKKTEAQASQVLADACLAALPKKSEGAMTLADASLAALPKKSVDARTLADLARDATGPHGVGALDAALLTREQRIIGQSVQSIPEEDIVQRLTAVRDAIVPADVGLKFECANKAYCVVAPVIGLLSHVRGAGDGIVISASRDTSQPNLVNATVPLKDAALNSSLKPNILINAEGNVIIRGADGKAKLHLGSYASDGGASALLYADRHIGVTVFRPDGSEDTLDIGRVGLLKGMDDNPGIRISTSGLLKLMVGEKSGLLKLMVGDNGPYISVNKDKILFTCGPSQISLDKDGIHLVGPNIKNSADNKFEALVPKQEHQVGGNPADLALLALDKPSGRTANLADLALLALDKPGGRDPKLDALTD